MLKSKGLLREIRRALFEVEILVMFFRVIHRFCSPDPERPRLGLTIIALPPWGFRGLQMTSVEI